MRKGFEVNGDYRLMDSSELVYILTNSAVMVNKVQEKEVVYGEECSFEDVLAKMTPGKRNLVMAGVELYKRCNSNKNQRPVIRQSTDIYDYMQPVLGDNKTEECWAILMNSSARVIKTVCTTTHSGHTRASNLRPRYGRRNKIGTLSIGRRVFPHLSGSCLGLVFRIFEPHASRILVHRRRIRFSRHRYPAYCNGCS